jgi:hypothetical protein
VLPSPAIEKAQTMSSSSNVGNHQQIGGDKDADVLSDDQIIVA